MLWTLSLFSLFALPQLLGVLLYFRLARLPRLLAFALGVLVPTILFFYFARMFFYAGLVEATAKDQVTCGMPFVAAAIMILTGTVVQSVVAFIIQLCLFFVFTLPDDRRSYVERKQRVSSSLV
jgi:hypothetical protein